MSLTRPEADTQATGPGANYALNIAGVIAGPDSLLATPATDMRAQHVFVYRVERGGSKGRGGGSTQRSRRSRDRRARNASTRAQCARSRRRRSACVQADLRGTNSRPHKTRRGCSGLARSGTRSPHAAFGGRRRRRAPCGLCSFASSALNLLCDTNALILVFLAQFASALGSLANTGPWTQRGVLVAASPRCVLCYLRARGHSRPASQRPQHVATAEYLELRGRG
jgi:hypothetical protein